MRTLVDWALTITVAVIAVLIFQAEVAKPYRIPTPSMEPTLHCAKPVSGCESRVADRVIANRLVYRFHEPERGDIIVFDTPARVEAVCAAGGTFIKRIVGLPGESVSMRAGYVFINGERLSEPYLQPGYRGRESGSWARSPSDGYFVLGDNRAKSCDSRRWGVVPRDRIIGRAEVTYWPPPRLGRLSRREISGTFRTLVHGRPLGGIGFPSLRFREDVTAEGAPGIDADPNPGH